MVGEVAVTPWKVRLKIDEPGKCGTWYREVVVMARNGLDAIRRAADMLEADYVEHRAA